jgi:hypothetical protein
MSEGNDGGAETYPRIFGGNRQARWTGQPPRADQIARATNGRHPRDEARSDQSGQAVAAAQSQIVKAYVRESWR